MPTANAPTSPNGLTTICDTLFANTGTVGYVALIKPDLSTNITFTANASTDLMTTASAHGLVTGERIRVAVTGGSLPTPLVANTDYYVIVVSTTTFRLATTQANALAGSPVAIDLTDAGSGTLTFNEQELNKDDPLAVLLAKELTHPSWSARAALTDLGAATVVSGNGEKPPKAIAVQNTSGTALSYKHVLFLFGAGVTATIGSTPTGSYTRYLATETTTQTINTNETKSLVFKMRVAPIV